MLDAITFFGIRSHVSPVRIFQSIASGLLGRDSFQMGWRSAVLGAFLHYFIAFSIVIVFYFASRRAAFLLRRPVISGIAYGIGVYCFMNYVVLPLSAAGRGAFVLPVFINGILIHMLGVGLPSAWFAASVRRA